MSDFVPIVLKLEEAQAAFNACKVGFEQLIGIPKDHPLAESSAETRKLYARAMYEIGTAIDKVTQPEPPHDQ